MTLDPRFIVNLDKDASSPRPQVAIWRGQKQCVTSGFADDYEAPSSEKCADIIIRKQLNVEHWSVLMQAFIKLNTAGFPHSVVSQMTRHGDTKFLVQSGRYTGKQYIQVANGEMDVEEAFYFRPPGFYTDRFGKKYEHLATENTISQFRCLGACKRYA